MRFSSLASSHIRQSTTVDIELKKHQGIGPGFDFWRFFLSASVMFLHTFHVCYGTAVGGAKVGFLNPAFGAILPIFFGLSGFLVAGSALRTDNLEAFLSFRTIRLVPALFVEVSLSALILGPIITTIPLSKYFSSEQFYAYFGNIVGRVRYHLPGVFEGNPIPLIVNQNLWTLHAELECYLLMSVAILLGLLKRRRLVLVLWTTSTLVMIVLNFSHGWFIGRGALYPTSLFVYAFCTGVIAFLWKDKIVLSPIIAILMICAYVWLYFFKSLSILAIAPLIYIMVWVGMQTWLQSSLFRRGDYSYGLYLYGFVIQQSIAWAFPAAREWWILFPLSLLLTLGFAIFSWHNIEKPALKLKKLISRRSVLVKL